jgi:hypothetical protein
MFRPDPVFGVALSASAHQTAARRSYAPNVHRP